MRQYSLAFSFLLVLCLVRFSNASLLPFSDRPGSSLTDLWLDRFPDPFRVLEQIPLGLDKDESVALSPARAKLENGVLTLSLAKLSPDKIKGPKVVSIEGGEEPAKLKSDEAKQEL
ncbi:unnamed protein product [Dovyalis caffra]|uniref:SHSP domain-containing protein n=1 Tax=Dovyalis caffra TaxID=77055 RepID=A0AAV1RTM6_9ROSI|nr:unnamed protein product [Dovyalis caffra]